MKFMKPHLKKYLWRMMAGLAGYTMGLFALNYFDAAHLPHRYWLVFLPLLPLIYVVPPSFALFRRD
jgi:hypothetical protein